MAPALCRLAAHRPRYRVFKRALSSKSMLRKEALNKKEALQITFAEVCEADAAAEREAQSEAMLTLQRMAALQVAQLEKLREACANAVKTPTPQVKRLCSTQFSAPEAQLWPYREARGPCPNEGAKPADQRRSKGEGQHSPQQGPQLTLNGARSFWLHRPGAPARLRHADARLGRGQHG